VLGIEAEGKGYGGQWALAGAAAIVGLGFLGSRLLGVLRTVAIADAFGTSPELSAYWVAFRLPDLVFQVLAGATMASAFIPTFATYWGRRGPEEAWRLASSVLNAVLLATLLLALLALVLAPWLVPLMAPGLGQETGRQEELQGLAVDLTRLMLISPVLFAVSGMVTGILNARHRFLLPALAPMLYNLAIIGGALLLAEPLGIRGLAVGVVAGAGLHLLVQVPGLVRAGLLYRPTVHWRDRGLREVAGLMLPRILGLAAAQFNFIVALFFASREGDEVIAALNYAWLIATLPLALFGMAIATAVFPTLAEQAAGDEMGKLRSTLAGSLRFALFLTIPASAGLILLRWPVVTFLLEHGAFTQTSTEITGNALLFYALGLWAHGATEVLSRGFYALRDTRTPVALAVLAMLLNWLFIVVLVGPLGYRGIALAMSLAASVEAGLLLLLLRRRLGGLREGEISGFLHQQHTAGHNSHGPGGAAAHQGLGPSASGLRRGDPLGPGDGAGRRSSGGSRLPRCRPGRGVPGGGGPEAPSGLAPLEAIA